MDAVRRDGLTKEDIHEKFDCVVGVQDASFVVGRGEIFCIMGLSGSGKSTLIRHINRLIEPTSGTVYIEGQNVNAMNPRDLRALRAERIGMVFQSMALMPRRAVRDIAIMESSIKEQNSPSLIAEELGMSTRQRERLFCPYLNFTPKHYFTEMRLTRAQNFLVQSEQSITEIALACGFRSTAHFSRYLAVTLDNPRRHIAQHSDMRTAALSDRRGEPFQGSLYECVTPWKALGASE